MNKQRESVYTLRRELLEGKIHLTEDEIVDTRGYLMALAEELLDEHGRHATPARTSTPRSGTSTALKREVVARSSASTPRSSTRSTSTA